MSADLGEACGILSICNSPRTSCPPAAPALEPCSDPGGDTAGALPIPGGSSATLLFNAKGHSCVSCFCRKRSEDTPPSRPASKQSGVSGEGPRGRCGPKGCRAADPRQLSPAVERGPRRTSRRCLQTQSRCSSSAGQTTSCLAHSAGSRPKWDSPVSPQPRSIGSLGSAFHDPGAGTMGVWGYQLPGSWGSSWMWPVSSPGDGRLLTRGRLTRHCARRV